MKNLIDLRSRLHTARDELETQLDAIRSDRAGATHTAPFDEAAAVQAMARAKTQDLLHGTHTAPALEADFNSQREAVKAALANEDQAHIDSVRAERHLLAELEMLGLQIDQLDSDIANGLKAAAAAVADKALASYEQAAVKLFAQLITLAAASRLSGAGRFTYTPEVRLPWPIGVPVPKAFGSRFFREGSEIVGMSAYVGESISEAVETLRAEIQES